MKYSRSLVATLLMSGGLINSIAPVFADVPRASTEIENTATASYDDGNGATVNTSSNTVKITVAKVAGILVNPTGFEDITTANAFKAGNDIYANFDVINTGNDGVKFNVPKLATIVTPPNTTAPATFTETQYFDGTDWITVTATAGAPSQTIPVGGTLKVRVKAKIAGNATVGSNIIVKLGQTVSPTTVASVAPHIERGVGVGEGVEGNDIFTVDVSAVDGTIVKLGGAAANGIRETSAQQTIKVEAIKQAFPIIGLASGTPVPLTPTTDTIPYTVDISVSPTDTTGSGKVATALSPTVIKLGTGASPAAGSGVDTPRVIVTTSIPPNSTFASLGTVPTDWTPVYSKTVYSAVPGAAATVLWSTTPPANLADVKQVGFIYTPSGTTATVGIALPINSTASFPINVTTDQLGTFNAVSAIIGTSPDALGAPDPNKPATATEDDAVTTARSAPVTPGTPIIFNGPVNDAQAKGPGGNNNTDFTNKSMAISGTANTTRNAAGNLPTLSLVGTATTLPAVTFSNAVKNPNNANTDIYLLPTAPATAGDLPTGTKVTIKNSDGSQTRTYTYSGTAFAYTSSNTTITTPIVLPSVAANGGTAGYSVDVVLPVGSAQLVGSPVPITAFIGGTITNSMAVLPVTGGTGATATVAPTATNTTIDRVYTGFINLVKEVRALDSVGQEDDTSIPYLTGTASVGQVKPGKFIQYRIRAVNIVPEEDTTATGSQTLKAQNLNVKEDGVFSVTNPNNWAANTTHETGTAKARLGTTILQGTVTFGGKTDSDADVSRYDANFAPTLIAPGETGSFTFIRKVNAPGTLPQPVAPVVPAPPGP